MFDLHWEVAGFIEDDPIGRHSQQSLKRRCNEKIAYISKPWFTLANLQELLVRKVTVFLNNPLYELDPMENNNNRMLKELARTGPNIRAQVQTYTLVAQPVMFTTWGEMKRMFLEKFFPTSRTTTIRKDIWGIRASNLGSSVFAVVSATSLRLCALVPQEGGKFYRRQSDRETSLTRFLNLLIENFVLAICLGMVGCGDFMRHPIFLKQGSHGFAVEGTALVTFERLWNTKPVENIGLENVHYYFGIIGLGHNGFYPS
ncbi:hypothetical protein CR513_18838, partial [Mucuna pruriens]